MVVYIHLIRKGSRPCRKSSEAMGNFRNVSDTSSTRCPRAEACSTPTTCSVRFTAVSSVFREDIEQCRDGIQSNHQHKELMLFTMRPFRTNAKYVFVCPVYRRIPPRNVFAQDIFEFSAAFPRKSAFDVVWEDYVDRTVAWCDRLVADTAPIRLVY